MIDVIKIAIMGIVAFYLYLVIGQLDLLIELIGGVQ